MNTTYINFGSCVSNIQLLDKTSNLAWDIQYTFVSVSFVTDYSGLCEHL